MTKLITGPHLFNSISDLHKVLGFPKPLHPMVSLVNYADITTPFDELPSSLLLDFYKISYKKGLTGKIRYGQEYYDFDEGGLSFIAPNQVISAAEEEKDYSGYTLLVHPDFIRNYPLGTKMKNYGFFAYAANEALYLSDKERQTIFSVFENIKEELNHPIDEFSQDVVVSQIEVLLNYSSRFYKRQFNTRKMVSNDLLNRLDQTLASYFDGGESLQKGVPTVEFLASRLQVSPRYLSDMLRSLTGQNAQQHIQLALVNKAKDYLASTSMSVAEVAYQLGFEHPQSFNKVFKRRTNLSPLQYKESLT